MKSKEEIVIINAIPNSSDKVEMLEKQIHYFSKLNLPILVVSGCDIPQHILPTIDYYIVNTDNERIEKDYSCKMYEAGLTDLALDHEIIGNALFNFYWPTVNSTITKNIKLGFNMAKILNYKRAIYTEDDNIFKDGSFYFLNENMNALRNGYKFAAWKGMMSEELPMMCTAFFFADINFLCNSLTLPHMKDEWYDVQVSKTYHFHKPYEYVYYRFFEQYDHLVYDCHDSYTNLIKNNENNSLMEFGQMNRRFSEKNLINTFFTVVRAPNDNNKKILILLNKTAYMPNGGINYNIDIFYDDNFVNTVQLDINAYYHVLLSDDIKQVKLNISGYGERIIDCDINSVKNNGHVIFF